MCGNLFAEMKQLVSKFEPSCWMVEVQTWQALPKLFESHLMFVVAEVSKLIQNHRGPFMIHVCQSFL